MCRRRLHTRNMQLPVCLFPLSIPLYPSLHLYLSLLLPCLSFLHSLSLYLYISLSLTDTHTHTHTRTHTHAHTHTHTHTRTHAHTKRDSEVHREEYTEREITCVVGWLQRPHGNSKVSPSQQISDKC